MVFATVLGLSGARCPDMTSPHHPKGSPPRPIGKFASVSEAARKLGVTRQEAKRILEGGKA